MDEISRRKFIALTATGIATAPRTLVARSIGSALTAQEIVDRIKTNIGVDWKLESVDTFKAGDPSTAVTGIVTTSLASLEVLGRAVKAGANMVVTCEPTFFAKVDTPTPSARRGAPGTPSSSLAPDPVFSAKNTFIKNHNLVVFRLSDHWRLRTPDPFAQGLADMLGWSKFAAHGNAGHFSIPEISLDTLVSHIKRSLNARGGMRIVGDPQLRVRKVALLPGSTAIDASTKTLPSVDAIIAGEVREWESVEYVRDTVALGGKKSLTLVGRIVSEDPGMRVCARWLKTIIPEVTSTWITAGDPYWRSTL